MEKIMQLSSFKDWIALCLTPLTPSPCGIDLRYEDDYLDIKRCIESIDPKDYTGLKDKCHKLLLEKSKDLRVTGFLIVALAFENGLIGVLIGLDLYCKLITTFGQDLFPNKKRARHAAVTWLNLPKLTTWLNETELSLKTLDELDAKIERFDQTVSIFLDEQKCYLPLLKLWGKEKRQSILSATQAPPLSKDMLPQNHDNAPQEDIAPSSNNHPTPPKPLDEAIDLDTEAPKLQIQLLQTWQNRHEWLLSCQIARAWNWQNIDEIKALSGKTTLPPPRKEAITSLKQLAQSNNPEILFETCENLFIEPEFKFFLDLQRLAFESAKNIGYLAVADAIYSQAQWLIQHAPNLLNAQYNNGLFFADENTIEWLTHTYEIDTDEKELSPTTLLQELSQQHQQLPALLRAINQTKKNTPQQNILVLHTQAKACVLAKQNHLALVYYQSLCDYIDEHHYATWYLNDALVIWKEVLSCVEHTHPKTDEFKPLQRRLQKKICLQGPEHINEIYT